MARKKTAIKTDKPVWLKYTEQEVKDIILNIIKKQPELTAEKIGLILRDTYGIPKTKIYGFKIGDVLKSSGLYKIPELENLKKKVEMLESHIKKNKQDQKTKRATINTKAKLKKTKEYIEREEQKRNNKKK